MRNALIILATMILAFTLTAYAGGGTYMNVSTDRKYVVGYTKGRYVVRNGKTVYIPGTPIFATKTTGFSVTIGKVNVKNHGIRLGVKVKKVGPKDLIADIKGNTLSIAKGRDYTINGTRSRLVGKQNGRVFFRQLNSRKYVSVALVNNVPSKAKSSGK
jgi:hypothetical protein